MNYGDSQQQQQYMAPTMSPGQRMPVLNQQAMPMRAHQPMNSSSYSVPQSAPLAQHQPSLRVGPAINTISGNSQSMIFRQHPLSNDMQSDMINQLTPDVRLQLQNETDPERKKIIFQNAMRRQFEQRQQTMNIRGMPANDIMHIQQQRMTSIAASQQHHPLTQNSVMYCSSGSPMGFNANTIIGAVGGSASTIGSQMTNHQGCAKQSKIVLQSPERSITTSSGAIMGNTTQQPSFFHQSSGNPITQSTSTVSFGQGQLNQMTMNPQYQFIQQQQFHHQIIQQQQFQQTQQSIHNSQQHVLQQPSQQINQSSLQSLQSRVLQSHHLQSSQQLSHIVGTNPHSTLTTNSDGLSGQQDSPRNQISVSQQQLYSIPQQSVQPVVQQQQQKPIQTHSAISSSPPSQPTNPPCVKPATPSNRSVPSVGAPTSVPGSMTTGSQVSDQQQQQPEYRAALEQLKSYQDFCKRLISRLRVDGSQSSHLEKSVERVIEIIEGRRIVDLKLIERLVKNVRSTMMTNDPSRGIMELSRKLSSDFYLDIRPARKILPDIWGDTKNMRIRSDGRTTIIKLCKKGMKSENCSDDWRSGI